MKRSFIAFLIVAAAAVMAGCSHPSTEPPAEKTTEPESRIKHGTNGEVIVTLDAATQKLMGLQVAPLAPAELTPEVKAFGRVVDPAPLADLLIELSRAELAYDTALRELDRMKVLRKENNTSERAFETAETQYRASVEAIGAIRLRLRRAWGGKLADLAEPMVVPAGSERKPDPLLSELAEARNSFLVRVDWPVGQPLPEKPVGARLIGLGEASTVWEAAFFDFAPTVDPQTQARGLFFLGVERNPMITPGMAMTALISTGQPPETGILVPRDAVLRFKGLAWLYLQTGDATFQRGEVALDRPLAEGWFVREGFKPEDKVVTVGAQQLLSEELKGQIGGD